MTLQLALKLTADATSLRQEASAARKEIDAVGKEARSSAADLEALGKGLDRAGAEASGLNSGAAAARKEVDALGREAREAAGAVDALGNKLDAAAAAGRRATDALGKVPTPAAGLTPNPMRPSPTPAPAPSPTPPAPAQRNNVVPLRPDQRANLMYQANDVAQSLALGLSPLQVALQQGPQIIQIYGGVRQTLSAATAVLTPLRLGLGGVSAALLVGASAWNSYLQSTKAVETALAGIGRGSGATASQIERIATEGAAAANISVSSARSMSTELLRTGKIGVESFSGIIGMSKNFAATIGTDVDAAKGILAEIFADPAKGAEQLFSRYRLIDSATMRYVQQLVAQNREEEARLVLIAKLPDRLASAEKSMTAFGRAVAAAGKVANDGWNALGRTIDRAMSGPTRGEQIERLEGLLKFGPDRHKARWERELAELRAAEKAEADRAAANAEAQRSDNAGNKAFDLAKGSPVNERAKRLAELKDQLKVLEDGRAAPNLEPHEIAQIEFSIEATKRAIDGLREYRTEAEKKQALDRIDAQIAQTRDPVTRAELAAQREKIALSGEVVTGAMAEAAAEQARTRALQEAIGAARTRAADLGDQAKAQRNATAAVAGGASQADAERQMRLELELRPLLAAAAKAEGEEKRVLLERIEALKRGYADLAVAEKEAAGQRLVSDQEQQLERLRAEIAVVGESAETQRKVIALVAAEQKIREQGLTGDLAARYRTNEATKAEATASLERQKAAYSELQSAGSRALDTLGEKLLQGREGWKDMGSVAKSVAQDLLSTLMKLAVLNPLKNALFGTNNPTISEAGGIGGLFSWLFGGGKGLGAANENAKVSIASSATQSVSSSAKQIASSFGGIRPSSEMSAMLASTAGKYGIDPNQFATLARIESGFNPAATNGKHAGLFQFAPSTGLQYGLGGAARFDASASADAAARLWRDNAAALRPVLGRDAMGWETYVAHQQGIGGAKALFANPNMRATDALNSLSYYRDRPGLAAQAITGNGGRADMTSTQFLDVWKQKFEAMGGSLDAVTKGGEAAGKALEAVQPAVKDVSSALSGSASALAGAGGKIEVSAEKIAGGSSGGGILETLLGGIGKLVSGIASTIGSVLQSVLGGLGGLLKGGGGLLSSLFGAGAPTISSGTGGLYHVGGIVGAAAPSSRPINIADWVGAPRLHTGALLPGERRTILRDGEGVFTPEQMNNAEGILAAALKPREVRLVVDNTMRSSTALPGAGESSRRTTNVQVFNNGRPVDVAAEEEDGPDGRRMRLWIDEQTAEAAGRPGSHTGEALRARFGVGSRRIRR
ncbi:MAG: phage tail length tape measure family protein [Bosea sp.]|uniref:phage tail length tape measure family protein n=1 Tax=Bosea sp. (in: a-proteobacteria) TaxID=1871050 RepID=UPI001AD0C1A0|nr:phage tail length tape measure family protein [Bosea sp. (in: a-proteobacteria)]MBN9471664.1 phage tail length tape measure family protein [Bosea sp. (in: a-proteobacteria)]